MCLCGCSNLGLGLEIGPAMVRDSPVLKTTIFAILQTIANDVRKAEEDVKFSTGNAIQSHY